MYSLIYPKQPGGLFSCFTCLNFTSPDSTVPAGTRRSKSCCSAWHCESCPCIVTWWIRYQSYQHKKWWMALGGGFAVVVEVYRGWWKYYPVMWRCLKTWITRWWFETSFSFTPDPWEDDPIWLIFFKWAIEGSTFVVFFSLDIHDFLGIQSAQRNWFHGFMENFLYVSEVVQKSQNNHPLGCINQTL